jgi:phosphoglycolate phosphatase
MTALHGADTVLFDMDGTLSRSEGLALDAAERGLDRFYGEIGEEFPRPSRGEIRSWIGLPSSQYFARLVPEALRGRWTDVRKHVLALELEYLRDGRGGTFEGTEDVLGRLRRAGKRLGLVTNAGRGYFRATCDALGLDAFFEAAFCIDDAPGGTKADLVRRAADALATRRGVMVGDKSYDIDAGRAHGFATVGCSWGYARPGELDGADAVIDDIRALPELLGIGGAR